MKAVKFFLGALALATVSMFAAPAVNAQENGNKDENGKVVRGPYLTNQFGDNWFISGSVGLNLGYDNSTWSKGLGLDFNLGKWVTPSVGARAGFNGITMGPEDKFGYLHADVLWNNEGANCRVRERRRADYLEAGERLEYDLSKAQTRIEAVITDGFNALRESQCVNRDL